MLLADIRSLVIKPALDAISLWTPAAENLVYATGLVETGYTHLKQIKGPALGYFQCEPETHKSLKIYLTNRSNHPLLERILATTYMQCLPLDDSTLIWNLRYAAIICRIHYYRIPDGLPDARDAQGLCKYYLRYYNTSKGAATFEKCIGAFEEACGVQNAIK